ncbi:serine hydrolase domain-containing protein [Chitinophaga sedimenti]|uniref:serine hydrolase domain-containing protein n=1 Tax=Chitinophaga sedimenti TaxID=2033606 RepID=UPI0027DEB43D|nr:serine hydrolase domain-containing protein [Chitinophaga sedimenti]
MGGRTRYGPPLFRGGILITQQILTDLTKQPYEQYMEEQVLRPMGMTNSSFNQPPAASQRKNLATGYKSNGDEVPGKYFVYPEKAAAGLWTTPTDICKYILEIQQAYQGKSSKVLNQEMAKLHVTPYKNDVAMGTYLQVRNGEAYFVHSASNEGFTGYFLGGLTNGKGVALFANSGDGYVLLELLNSIAQVYNWKGFSKPEQITTVPVSDTLTSKYVGEYILGGWLSEIKKEKDGLYLWSDGISSKMYFISPTEFRNIELGGTKTFTFDSAGAVAGYSNTVNGRLLATGQKITSLDTLKPRPGQSGVLGRHLLEAKSTTGR